MNDGPPFVISASPCFHFYRKLELLVLAVFFPHPTDFQYTVFRIVLALAAAGVAAFIPGFIAVEINKWLKAGGAIAVFVIVYFFSPANLVAQPNSVPAPTAPFSIHIIQPSSEGSTANRFTFPYSDIEKDVSFASFSDLLRQLPNSDYSRERYTIFRVRDEVILIDKSD